MNKQDKLSLIEVFAGELWKATMIKNVLEDNNIQAFLENSLMGVLEPWVISPGGYAPVKVMVPNIDYNKAIQLIDEFNNSEPIKED